jgi:glycerone phosphate O-acyltransferase/fatty acyl-CoA reductase
MNSVRGFAWFLHKLFRTIYEKVVVDKLAIMKLKNWDEKVSGSLILVPTHRSYIDFLILSYVFFGYGIKVPFIAAAEDFLNIVAVHILLRRSGAFFIQRNQKKFRNLYKAIMAEYITKLLADNHYLEFFIEGTRSRVGKMMVPKLGILSIICKNVLEGKIPDAQLLPVTINYEKLLEGASYTYEMMGETKVKESLTRMLKAVDVLK